MQKFFSVFLSALALIGSVGQAAEIQSLAGEWRFALDRHDVGIKQDWFAKKLTDKIQLPGILQGQGYGNKISIHTPWVMSLYDHHWYLRQAYEDYTNAGDVKVPFLCQPPRHYLGAAWYQRDIEIPTNWLGHRVELFLERPHWKTTVWLDDKKIGSDISLCTPHEYSFGCIAPGKHRLTIRVDNRMILPYRPDAHSVSDSLGAAWNGIVGKIQLRATPPVWIDNVQVFPEHGNHAMLAKIHLGNITGKAGKGTLWFGSEKLSSSEPGANEQFTLLAHKSVTWNTNGANIELQLTKAKGFAEWSEFHPNLYTLHLQLHGPGINATRDVVFGCRHLKVVGHQFMLNGRPIYFRGTHFGGDFPLTGYPATDVASWKKIIRTCLAYGLNHIRFHSWCPPQAAFVAADELGFYLQIECGMWNSFRPGGIMQKMLYSETRRILRDYGNHPSFMLISASNEAHGDWKPVLSQWVKHFRGEDSRHLYTPDTGWSLINSPTQPLHGGADYLAVARIGPHHVRGEAGWFGRDYESAIRGVKVPIIAHEVGQWCAYPNYDVIAKFTGYIRPGNFEIFRNSAAAHGVLADDKKFAWASGRFQLQCYKEEIEANLRTPGLNGFQLLDLHDYTGQGTALVGVLDPFWQSKGDTTPRAFREFCNTVVPLARLTKRVFISTDKLDVPVEVANYSSAPLTNITVVSRILDANGAAKVISVSRRHNIPFGKSSLETLKTSFASLHLHAPGQYRLQIGFANTPFTNTWNFWLYPAHISQRKPANVLLTRSWQQAEQRLAKGGRVIFVPRLADLSWWSPPLARVPIFWNAQMGPTWARMLGLWCNTNSAALAEFPTQPNCDWQWTQIVHDTRAINLNHFPRQLQPIVSAIDDWNRNYKLGVIFQAKVQKGRLLVCSVNLDSRNPVAQQLRRSLLDYAAGDKFHPQTRVSVANMDSLFFDNLIMHQLGAKATADGHPAPQIVDGDPNTFWTSADAHGRSSPPPHQFIVSFPKPVTMKGIVLMARQNQREYQGDIRKYALATSDDGIHWQTVSHGELPSTFNPLTISFSHRLTTKYLKLTSLAGFGHDPSASLAELAVIYAGPGRMTATGRIQYRHVGTASPDIDAGSAP